jgi:uncharacterized protein (DUF1501 family)
MAMRISRRAFIQNGALLVASGLTAPSFIARTALALDPVAAQTQGLGVLDPARAGKILVAIQMSGGNDGLNTVVPFADPAYAHLRPTLAIKPEQALKLTDSVGLHPNLGLLKGLYDQGRVAIIQAVGYPNPNRSHFRSMDIWHSAAPDTFERSGWLGRYLEACRCSQGRTLPALSVSDQLNGMFWTDAVLVPAVSSIGAFSFQTDTKYRNDRQYQMQTLLNIYNQAGSWSRYESLIRQGTLSALQGSDQLQKAAESYRTTVQYPGNNGLANQLKMVAQVLAADLGARLFSVQIGGFDTHGNQANTHANLMRQFSEAVDAFVKDLAAINKQDDVVIMTFSEFGRRAKQNGSAGTDHGAAEPLFVIGNAVKGGLYGEHPSLSDLDRNGDIKYKVDFRSVYAGLLRDYLGADATRVLAGSYAPVGVLKASA